ncbi:uncharacterized protein Cpr97Eb [Anabrus simplex]|uniref:uncharacterized protein Cpr97Eb n=1 Tax=Anabrus simplex TaxID=316456 RepID=UPI0035A37750
MGATLRIAVFLALGCIAQAQYRQPPVAILKQINRHNEDGSYSYGYEAGDGSFKIETKYPTGEVQGKYGYVDDSGKVREVEYGASSRGFEPTGSGINVPPPTLNGNYVGPEGYDDGQYHEDPSIYYKDERYNKPAQKSYSAPTHKYSYNPPAPKSYYSSEPEPEYYNPPPPTPAPRQRNYNPPAPQYSPPAPQYNPPAPQYNAPAPQYNPPAPQYNPPPQQSYYRPPANRHHVDPGLFGSYSVVYDG